MEQARPETPEAQSTGQRPDAAAAAGALPEVLIIEDDGATRLVLQEGLKDAGFAVRAARDARSGLAMLHERLPALVLVDQMLPGMSGMEVCRHIRQDPAYGAVPLVILTARRDTADKINSLAAGADDYLTKPFVLEELVARLHSHVRRSERERELSPLTGLPGNLAITRVIGARLSQGVDFAVAWIDIDFFKTYNDRYGFLAGDGVIRQTAALLCAVVESELEADSGDAGSFAGHIGGDDFVLVVPLERAEEVAQAVVDGFDGLVQSWYAADDVAKGYVVTPNRRGETQRFPLMSVSVALVPCSAGRFQHPGEVVMVATELKRLLKLQSGSSWMMDRRTGGSRGAHLRGGAPGMDAAATPAAVEAAAAPETLLA